MPPFTPLPGDIVGAPPYLGRDCLTQGLFLRGDLAAQQRFCDLALNGPAGGSLTFRAVTEMVLMTAIYSSTLGSTNAADRDKGVMQEWDVGFWTAVRGGRPGDEDNWKSYWLPSFLFVDSAAAMAAGREVFGYPKTAAAFQDRGEAPGDPSATIIVRHFRRFGPEARPVVEPLVRITAGENAGPAPGFVQSIHDAWSIVSGIAPIHLGFTMPTLPGLGMPQVMLRQARDPTEISAGPVSPACLQEILLVTPTPVAIRDIGPLHTPVQVEITASASHPIMETLGLGPSQVGELGFWLDQDFEVGAAERLA
jgi:hypothetical protein